MAFGWLKKAVRSAGKVGKGALKVAAAPMRLTAKAGRSVSRALGRVPVVGGGLKGVFDLTSSPFQIADKISKGERIDKVATATLRENVQSVKATAPYAQTVISFVPGVGQGVNATIGAGLALASGQPITKALKEGVKQALPGGPLAKGIFDATEAAIEGKPISQIAINALPLDSQAKRGVSMALDVTARLSRGERVDRALVAQADKALKLLPKSALEAFSIGSAVSEAQKLQKIAMNRVSPVALNRLARGGKELINSSPVLRSASGILRSGGAREGYAVGAAVMATKRPQPFHVAAIRNRLQGPERAGFDMAVAAHAGMVRKKLRAPVGTPAQQLGYYVAHGTPDRAMVLAVGKHPTTRGGVIQAMTEKPSLWIKFKEWLVGT